MDVKGGQIECPKREARTDRGRLLKSMHDLSKKVKCYVHGLLRG